MTAPLDKAVIRRMRTDDSLQVADLHHECFSSDFLAQLGRSFVASYFEEFCRHETDHAVVAWDEEGDQLAGFAVGTSDYRAHFRDFYQKHLLSMAGRVLAGLFVSKVLRKKVVARIRYGVMALMRPATRVDPKDPTSARAEPTRLLLFAVSPSWRGSGIASKVIEEFERGVRRLGGSRLWLTVPSDNLRAIRYYQKTGWEPTLQTSEAWEFEKHLTERCGSPS